MSGKVPSCIVLCASLRSTLSGPSLGRLTRFIETNHNSFSWPAKQVSHMDVVNKNIPDVFVTSMKATSTHSTLRFAMKIASAL
ncbi:MAG: hypothetical protein ACI8R9_002807 [Paraglaciecola sp.]|jgi:hypothetical protein